MKKIKKSEVVYNLTFAARGTGKPSDGDVYYRGTHTVGTDKTAAIQHARQILNLPTDRYRFVQGVMRTANNSVTIYPGIFE